MKIPYSVQPQVGIARETPAYQSVGQGQAEGAAGVGLGSAIAGIGGAIGGLGQLADQYLARQEKVNEFETARRFNELNGQLSSAFLELQRSAAPNGQGFSENVAANFEKMEKNFIDTLRPDQRAQFAPRLQALRNQYMVNSISHQFALQDQHGRTTFNNEFQESLKSVSADPRRLEGEERRIGELLIKSTLPRPEAEELARQALVGLRTMAARRDAVNDPVAVAGAAGGFRGALRQAESSGIPHRVNDFGFAGLYQFGAPRLAHMGVYTPGPTEQLKNWKDRPRAEQWTGTFNIPGFPDVKTLRDFLANPAAQEKAYDIHDQLMEREIQRRGLEKFIGTDVQGVKITREGLKAMIHLGGDEGTDKFLNGGRNEKDAYGTTLLNYARRFGNVAESSQRYAGVPLERLQGALNDGLRDRAHYDNLQATEQKQAQTAAINQLMLGIHTGAAGAGDIQAGRDQGWLDDKATLAAVKALEARDKKQDTLRTGLANIQNPEFVWNPFEKDQRAQINALSEALESNPSARMQSDLANWQRSGITSDWMVAQLNNGIISTEPQKMEAALQVIGNMLASNDNAFAGVSGAGELNRVGSEFQRLTSGLGMTTSEAARELARRNDPEFKLRNRPNEQAMQKFREDLLKRDVGAKILRAFNSNIFSTLRGAPRAATLGYGQAARDAIIGHYTELATQHFGEHGNRDAAHKAAIDTMKRQYGISQGRLMQFPPEKAQGYPAWKGSKDWVYQQAAEDIRAATGHEVDPKNVILVPTNGRGRTDSSGRPMSTRDTFANGEPVTYELQYITEENGIPIMHYMLGKGTNVPAVWRGDFQRFYERAMPAVIERAFESVRQRRRNDEARSVRFLMNEERAPETDTSPLGAERDIQDETEGAERRREERRRRARGE